MLCPGIRIARGRMEYGDLSAKAGILSLRCGCCVTLGKGFSDELKFSSFNNLRGSPDDR